MAPGYNTASARASHQRKAQSLTNKDAPNESPSVMAAAGKRRMEGGSHQHPKDSHSDFLPPKVRKHQTIEHAPAMTITVSSDDEAMVGDSDRLPRPPRSLFEDSKASHPNLDAASIHSRKVALGSTTAMAITVSSDDEAEVSNGNRPRSSAYKTPTFSSVSLLQTVSPRLSTTTITSSAFISPSQGPRACLLKRRMTTLLTSVHTLQVVFVCPLAIAIIVSLVVHPMRREQACP